MAEINSVTGHEVPHLAIAPEDRTRLWAALYPVVVFTALGVVAAGLVVVPNSPRAARLVRVVITPVWFVADVCLARRGSR